MGIRIVFYSLMLAFFIFFSAVSYCETEDVDNNQFFLELYSIGIPTAEKETDARNIRELFMFENRLYIGHGDAMINTGPTDIIYYDLLSGDFITEFTIDDEAIKKYCVLDGKLALPGVDATENWDYGNIYLLDTDGWLKKRTIRNGLHVFDLVSFGGKWFASTGCYFKLTEDDMYPFGGIFESEDEGGSWNLAYSTPTHSGSVFRISSLVSYKDKLYCFPYTYTGTKLEDIPEDYRQYLGKSYEGVHLIFNEDLFGGLDCITYDGNKWGYADILDKSEVCYITPFVFGDWLLMSVLSGQYVDYAGLSGGLPGNAETGLYSYNGKITEKINLEYDMIKDILIKEDALYLLIFKDNLFSIAVTKNMIHWDYYYLPVDLIPRSIEHDGETFFLGTDDGNIYTSNVYEIIEDTSYITNRVPMKITVAANLPRNGKSCWAAITNWEKWGKLATLSCEIKGDNLIEAKTENVSSFEVFIPFREIDVEKPIKMSINGNIAFEGKLKKKTSLNCEFTRWKKWKVKKGEETSQTFEHSKMFIGKTDIKLGRDGDDPPLGLWMTDVIRSAASSDIGIIIRGNLRKDLEEGEVSLGNLFDLIRRNRICKFKVSGEKLKQMMEFNIKLSDWRKFQISGFEMTYNANENPCDNSIVACTLDLKKEYTVVVPEDIARYAESFFGESLEYEYTGKLVTDAMIDWFEKYKKIRKLTPRIKIIK